MNPILHKLTTGAHREILGITFGNIYNMVLSADGKTLAFQRHTDGIEVWDLSTRRPLPLGFESRLDPAEIAHLALSNDGQILAASTTLLVSIQLAPGAAWKTALSRTSKPARACFPNSYGSASRN